MRIALCLKRTPELIVAVLAVLKAGGAYVPMESAYPREQLASMIEDSGASVLLTTEALLDVMPEHSLKTVCVDADADAIARASDENPTDAVSPANLAYAIYTSGSTGRPKLIGIEHQSAVNAVFHTTHAVLFPEDLVVVPFADNISFDASVYRIFSPLSTGGAIIILDSIFDLPESPHAASVTAFGGAPSVMRAFLRDFNLPSSVRVVSMGGEVAVPDLLEQLAAYPHVRRVVNFYGPTETTIYRTYAVLMERGEAGADASSPTIVSRAPRVNIIGRPISNVRVYILDALLRAVPVGVTGELFVGGECLARGYLNQDELNAEKFIPDPFDETTGARLYMTGDLARYLGDGAIEFLGRIDGQVQIHGLRVEPQGVEAVLGRHEAVEECVVRPAAGPSGEKYLVAYVVGTATDADGQVRSPASIVEELRAYLESKLPWYMAPLSFVLLERMPLTSRGKIDFSALPDVSVDVASRERAYAAPETGLEQKLVGIWEEVLSGKKVGLHDDFLELGGDSLSAMRLISRVNHALGAELSLRVVFQAPTVAEMARVVSGDGGET